jgi:hypothetical protein
MVSEGRRQIRAQSIQIHVNTDTDSNNTDRIKQEHHRLYTKVSPEQYTVHLKVKISSVDYAEKLPHDVAFSSFSRCHRRRRSEGGASSHNKNFVDHPCFQDSYKRLQVFVTCHDLHAFTTTACTFLKSSFSKDSNLQKYYR